MLRRLLPFGLVVVSLPAGAGDAAPPGAPTRGAAFVLREDLRMEGEVESSGNDGRHIEHSLGPFSLSESVVAHLVVTDVVAGKVARARLHYAVAERRGSVLGGPEAGRLGLEGRSFVVTTAGRKIAVTSVDGAAVAGMDAAQVLGDFRALVEAVAPPEIAASPGGTRLRGFRPAQTSLGWGLYSKKLEATVAAGPAAPGSVALELGFAGLVGSMLGHGSLSGTAALDPADARLLSMSLEGPVTLFGMEKVDGLMMTTKATGSCSVETRREEGAPHFPSWELPPAASVVDLVLARYAAADDLEWDLHRAGQRRLSEAIKEAAATDPGFGAREAMLQLQIDLSLTERAAGSREADGDLDRARRLATTLVQEPSWAASAFPSACELAFLELALANPEGASAAADQALSLAKTPEQVAEAHFWKAEALRAKGDPSGAAAAYTKAAETPFRFSALAAWGAAHSGSSTPGTLDVSGLAPESPAAPNWVFGADQALRDGRLGGTTRHTAPGGKG